MKTKIRVARAKTRVQYLFYEITINKFQTKLMIDRVKFYVDVTAVYFNQFTA